MLLNLVACGAGDGTKRELPPGEQTSAPPGDTVLYVSEGQGNRVVSYRVGTDGLLNGAPFSSIDLQNPRKLLLNGNVLFVALEDRIVSIVLGSDGSLPTQPTSVTDPVFEGNPLDMVLVDDVLYAAFENVLSILAYRLDRGQLAAFPLTISGTNFSEYRAIASANGFVYATSPRSGTIDTYVIGPAGALPETPDSELPDKDIDFPEDLLINDGILYLIDAFDRRIKVFPIQSNGLLPNEPTTETKRVESYVRALIDDTLLYASAYNEGRIDLYRLDPVDGNLVDDKPLAFTENDTGAFPIGLVLVNGVMYVTQAGRGRIDGYLVNSDGTLPPFPSTSTIALDGSFPNDIVSGSFPP